jgi:hypothetical protein
MRFTRGYRYIPGAGLTAPALARSRRHVEGADVLA